VRRLGRIEPEQLREPYARGSSNRKISGVHDGQPETARGHRVGARRSILVERNLNAADAWAGAQLINGFAWRMRAMHAVSPKRTTEKPSERCASANDHVRRGKGGASSLPSRHRKDPATDR
jgi:hypothetical protein